MKNPYEFTVLYRKDEILEEVKDKALEVEDHDKYKVMIDLEEIEAIEESLINVDKVSIATMKNGHQHTVLLKYEKLCDIVLKECSRYKDFMTLHAKQ